MDADLSIAEEKKLLVMLTKGDPSAFTTLYYRHGGRLHAHLLRMVKSEETAREIFQDCFLKVWELRDRIDVDKSFGGYLYRIAENKVFDHFRKAAREKRLAGDLSARADTFHTGTEDAVLYRESFTLIQKAIDLLPPTRKQVYVLSKLEGKSYEEVAALMGITTATVNDHVVKANRFLRSFLAGHTDAVIVWLLWFGLIP